MRVHAISTGTVRVTTRQRRGSGPGPLRPLLTMLDREFTDPLPIWTWAIEHPEGVIVVDTGETARTSEPGWFPRWHPYFHLAVRFDVSPEQEIGPQLRALGIEPGDVRKVAVTHLHTDHAGGLGHFPDSEILVSKAELDLASGTMGKLRGFIPHRWPGWFEPTAFETRSEPFGPFEASLPLTEAGDVRIVPTPGHTHGHVSVVLDEGERVVFFAGDTTYDEALLLDDAIDGVCPDPDAARATMGRIRAQAVERPTVYLPTHDPRAGERLEAREPLALA
ncbi:MAG TPA: N-acyl homoserine lactonase family protein [Thermoleophilaceae bacterium]|jgi:glyoxylase-like metal-dependent hydrolase (beta-lactamase superfamily II)